MVAPARQWACGLGRRALSCAETLTIPWLLRQSWRRFPEKRVLVAGPDGVADECRFDATYGRCLRLMSGLRSLGVRRGDRVATLARNVRAHHEAYFAVPSIGGVLLTLNARLPAVDLAAVLRHAEPKLVVAESAFAAVLQEAMALAGLDGTVLWIDGAQSTEALAYEPFLAANEPEAAFELVKASDAAGLCYTSGTTGEPKGVLYTHGTLMRHAWTLGNRDGFGLSRESRVMPFVPLFHANGWGLAHGAALFGYDLVYPGRLPPGAQTLSILRDAKVTIAAGVPSVWTLLLRAAEGDGLGFGALREAIIGGAAATADLINPLADAGVQPLHSWGMTELAPVGVVNREPLWRDPGEARVRMLRQGFPNLGMELRVVDSAGAPLDAGVAGALEARSPYTASAYYRTEPDPAIFKAEGWFRTGDIGVIDPDGALRLVDREKDLIKVGGEFVASLKIEAEALREPWVVEAAAVAQVDALRGERPALFLVARADASIDLEALRNRLLQTMARWQVPKLPDCHVIDALPRTGVGKVDKKALRRRLQSD